MELVGVVWALRVLGVHLESVALGVGGVGMGRNIVVRRKGALRVGLITFLRVGSSREWCKFVRLNLRAFAG